LSGLLVASGLILGAFTLHGSFVPQSPQQVPAAGTRAPAREEWVTTTRAVAGSAVVQRTDAPRPADLMKPDAKPAGATDADAAAERERKQLAAKKRAEKRLAEAQKLEKAKQPQPQQATLQWPWSWFGK
jgi:hypothetical protein